MRFTISNISCPKNIDVLLSIPISNCPQISIYMHMCQMILESINGEVSKVLFFIFRRQKIKKGQNLNGLGDVASLLVAPGQFQNAGVLLPHQLFHVEASVDEDVLMFQNAGQAASL